MKFNTLCYAMLLVFGLLSCADGGSADAGTEASPEETGPLTFETFSGVPSPLKGCACFFAQSDLDFEERKYLFANDNNASGDGTGMAFMRVRGKVRQFQRTNLEKDGDEGADMTYEADGYTLEVEANFGESLPGEAVRTTGNITLKGPDGETINTDYIGTCGC